MDLSFQFSSLGEFLQMGGYAQYVWLSYGIAFIGLGSITIASIRKRKAVLQQIASKQIREERLRQHRSQNQ
ncbi:heme exporter protein CcmD [Ferrimonas lipolytica]|uniref:Heme exporter protein D n=1 Tax=Ferrimonas lipolytica TaxID=2724191 RepID=A0A6H1UH99_9GAMM|nr:heme exporter protein CcmD [Ferrimonas lipolytica]QIZ78485.1 heme exporter protein CcmD [Ferrimonas lipolytica]